MDSCPTLIAHPVVTLLLVQSGATVFGLVCTPWTVARVPDDFVGYSGGYYERLVEVYSAADIPYEEAVWQTNRFFAEAFRLGLYRGPIGRPLEVEVRP